MLHVEALTPEEVATRIKAARLLRGISQKELAHRLADDGLAGRLVGHLERGEAEIRPVHLRALSLALGFPERWFTDPVDELCAPTLPESHQEQYAHLRGLLEEVLGRFDASR